MKFIKGKKYKITIKDHVRKNMSSIQNIPSHNITLIYDSIENDGLYYNCECCGKEVNKYHVFLLEGEEEETFYIVGKECVKKYVSEIEN